MSKKSTITRIDDFTDFIATISSDHAYIHDGIAFSISLDFGSISSAYHVALETPAASIGYIHFRPTAAGVTSDADSVQYLMRENITSYTGGTSYLPFNRNRNNNGASSVVVKYGVTPTLGTPVQLDVSRIGSSGGFFSGGGGSSGGEENEIVLKPETIYLFTFTPGGATNVTFGVFWYEEDMG